MAPGRLSASSSVQHQAGLSVRPVRLSLSAMSAPVIDAVRLYDPRGARVQIWRRTLSPETGLQVGVPEPWFKGFCNKAPIPRPEPGGEAILASKFDHTSGVCAQRHRLAAERPAGDHRNAGRRFVVARVR